MAKPDRKQTVIRIDRLDREHYAKTDRYARQVDSLYQSATREYSRLAGGIFEPDQSKPFSFADYPETRKKAAKIAADLAKNVQRVIEAGQRSEWIAGTSRANSFMGTVINRSKLTPAELRQYEDRNMEGLAAFQGRKVRGLGLSDRVWRITDQFTGHVELALDIAIGEGRSAQELSRDVRGMLKEPDKLFRRVRDKYGNLRLSKAASAYHPGRGVYRSSYRNAMRLARTEINMAYRTADWERWQREEFVVGFRIGLSNNHTIKNSKGEPEPLTDICDELAGDYPKTFKFVGWHPNCRCVMTPILKEPEEMNRDRRARLEAIMNDEEYKAQPSANEVNDVPEAFSRFIDSIAEQSKGWKSQPYWIRDNFKGGAIAGGLSPAVPHTRPVGGTAAKPNIPPTPCTDFDAYIDDLKAQAYALGLDISRLDPLRAAGQRDPLKAEVDRLRTLADDRGAEWLAANLELRNFVKGCAGAPSSFVTKYAAIAKANAYDLKRYYDSCIQALKAALSEAKLEWNKLRTNIDEQVEQRRQEYIEYNNQEWKPLCFDESSGGYNVAHKLHQFSKTKAKGAKMSGGEAEKLLGRELAKIGKAVEFLPESGINGKSGDMRFDGKVWDCKYIPIASVDSIRSYIKDARKADCVIFCSDNNNRYYDIIEAINREIGRYQSNGKNIEELPDVYFYYNGQLRILKKIKGG